MKSRAIKSSHEATGSRSSERRPHGTAERVANILRARITAGDYRPGERLSEEALAETLGVSRNTLREAFRLLSRERLIVLVFNRGASVRVVHADDVRDLYRARRMLQCAAIREFASRAADLSHRERHAELAPLWCAVDKAERAAEDGRWHEVATADLQFHEALIFLAASPRADELTHRIMAELRLAFSKMSDLSDFHRPFIKWNRELGKLLEEERYSEAESELIDYLLSAERALLAGYAPSLDPEFGK